MQAHEQAVNTCVYQSVQKFGGSISAEHGVGSMKVDSLPDYKDPTALALMATLKRALDPHNTLNPCRVVRV
jgi:FAD/FMN-containing dehydrogenase